MTLESLRRKEAAARLASHLRTPLFGGAYALILSSGVTSVLGIIYWTLAARLYDAALVGIAATMISTMTFISYLSQLNMAGSLTRFLPTAGPRTRQLVSRAYAASVLLSGAVAWVFVLGVVRWEPQGLSLGDDPAAGAWFVAATMAWSVFALQDAVLTGLRQTLWVPIENTVFAVAKIVLLAIFAIAFAEYGIFASWTIPAVVLLIPVNLMIFRRFIPRHVALAGVAHAETGFRQILRFLAGDYLGSLFVYASIGLMPLVVFAVIGPSGSAYFYVAWTIAYSLQLISINMATSLMVEGSSRRENLASDSRRAAILLMRLQVPAVAIVVVGAPLILLIFGRAYAQEAVPLLRLLALAVLPHAVNAIYLGVARVQREIGRIVLVQGTVATLSLVLSLVLLPLVGIVGVGIAWLVAQGLVAAVVYATQLRPLWRTGAAGSPVGRGSAAAAADGADNGIDAAPASGRTTGRGATGGPATIPLLGAALGALDSSRVPWALLRTERPDPDGGDLDILVAEEAATAVGRILERHGYLSIPGHGRGSHRFYVGYDADARAWVDLDVVSRLDYGRFFQHALPEASGVLERRRRADGSPVLDPDDAFWTLVLHCLFDKRRISARHRLRLIALVTGARADGPLGRSVARILPRGWDAQRVITGVRAGEWDALVALGPGAARRWWREAPLGTAARYAQGLLFRATEPVLLARRRRGLSVALLGPDGAGKSTLAASLVDSFGLPTRRVYMGMWAAPDGWRPPGWQIAIRPFVVWGRSIVAQYHRALGRLVVFDRYTYDALIPPRGEFAALKRAYFSLLARIAPHPDLTFVLDAPGEVLFERKGEFDPEALERDRSSFQGLVERLDGARILDATRPPAEILDEVTRTVWRSYQLRAGIDPDAEPAPPEVAADPAGRGEDLSWFALGGSQPHRAGPIDRLATGLLPHVGRARRRLGSGLRLGGAVGRVPGILEDLAASGADIGDPSWRVRHAQSTETGVAVVLVGPAGEPARLVIKLPRSAAAADALRTQAARLAGLREEPGAAGMLDLVPRVVADGLAAPTPYLIETLLPGIPATRIVRDPSARARLLPVAAEAIGRLHHGTSRALVIDGSTLDDWIDRPIQGLRSIVPGQGRGESGEALDALSGGLRAALAGRTVPVGWIHGDYWPGNLLVSDRGDEVRGIVDWDLAAPDQPALHDLVHLLLYARRLSAGRELGDVVRSFLRSPSLDPVERAAIEAAAWEWPTDPEALRVAVLLAWLRHVGTFVGVDGHVSNRIWVRRNVRGVLHDLAGAPAWVEGQASS